MIFVLLGTLIVASVLLIRSASVQADDAMMDLGRHLLLLSEQGMGNSERGVVINGQQVGFRVFTTEQEIVSVLDFYEGWCRGGRDEAPSQEDFVDRVDSSELITLQQDQSWTALTRRGMDDELGFVACIKHGLENASMAALGEKMSRFTKTGNLGELGQFHYATATRVGDKTRVVAVWTEGEFYPLSMFPLSGDAPGFEVPGLSRPPSGRRMLSSGEVGNAETLTMYIDCEESTEELAAFYRREFSKEEWIVMMDDAQEELHLFVVQRGADMRVIAISSEDSGRTVTIATGG